MSRLTARRYRDLCALVGDALDHPNPRIQPAGSPVGWRVGIYALGHRHAASGRFVVDYVGSAVRLRSDVAARIKDHLRDRGKADRFTCQVIIPLKEDLDKEEVRRLEGHIARALGVPRWCQRVPGGRR